METSAGEPLISIRPFTVTKWLAWLVSKESPLFLGFLPSYTKSATISYHTSCRRLLTDNIQKMTLGLQRPSVPKIVGRQNTRAGNVCTWSSGECNMCLLSCQQPLDTTHWPKTNRREFITIKGIAYYVKNTTTIHVYCYLIGQHVPVFL